MRSCSLLLTEWGFSNLAASRRSADITAQEDVMEALKALIGTVVGATLVFFAGAAMADWKLSDMNATINATNFIVGDGCSGTLISLKHRLVLTNHHCITNYISAREREEVQRDGTTKKVKREERTDVPLSQRSYQGTRQVGSTNYLSVIVAHWQQSDLALLQIRSETLPYTVASQVLPEGQTVQRGEQVYIVGNPAGLDATLTSGIVSSTTRMAKVSWSDGGEVAFIQFSGGSYFGNSGGALYNSKGHLIGVPAAMVGTSHLALAIHYKSIQQFLTDNCFGEVWSEKVETFDVCDEKRQPKVAGRDVKSSPTKE